MKMDENSCIESLLFWRVKRSKRRIWPTYSFNSGSRYEIIVLEFIETVVPPLYPISRIVIPSDNTLQLSFHALVTGRIDRNENPR